MIKVLFICHGNICRSAMAEFIMKKMLNDAGCGESFEIASAATSTEEIGNPVYPPAKKMLEAHGINCSGKTARQMKPDDYTHYDLLIGMDQENMYYMKRMYGSDSDKKLRLLLDDSDYPRDVADPWYTRDFQAAWDDIYEGCAALSRDLLKCGQPDHKIL